MYEMTRRVYSTADTDRTLHKYSLQAFFATNRFLAAIWGLTVYVVMPMSNQLLPYTHACYAVLC